MRASGSRSFRFRSLVCAALALLWALTPLHAARLFVASNGDKITVPSPAKWSSALSISVWVYPTSQPSGGYAIWSDTNGPGTQTFVLDYVNSSGTKQISVSWTTLFGQYTGTSANVTLSNGQWYHILWTADLSTNPDTYHCYVNGTDNTVTASPSESGPPYVLGGTCRIGSIFWGTEIDLFDGRIAEPAIWVDKVLNASQALALARGARADRVMLGPDRYYLLEGWQDPEPDYGVSHLGSTSITGTSRANGPPVVPR